MLDKATLDRITAGECQHKDHSPEACRSGIRFFHFRCHPDAPAFLIFPSEHPDAAIYQCCHPECNGNLIFRVQEFLVENDRDGKSGVSDKTGFFSQNCHPDSAVWASYTNGSGVLDIHCFECKAIVGHIKCADSGG